MSMWKIEFKGIYNSAKACVILTSLIMIIILYKQLGGRAPLQFIKSLNLINSTCYGTLFPGNVNSESNWGAVDLENTIFVISAYYVKERARIFIIGAKHVYSNSAVCQIWYTDPDNKVRSIQQTQAKVVAPIGRNKYKYISTIFACPIDSEETPTHVSLVMHSCDNPLNLLRIRDVSKPIKYERRFTVCLSPVHKFDALFKFVEWIELNRILGAEKILIYNHSTGVNVDDVIKYYLNMNIVEVINWKLPFPLSKIEYFAQKSALNDCIFKNRNVSEFIINIDKDEFIIPHSENVLNWSQMIEKFDKNYAGYLVKNTFYRTDWTDQQLNFTEKVLAEKLGLVSLTHFEHEKKIFSAEHRSKYFARTAFVEFGNIHEIPRGRVYTIPEEVGLLHHYRKEKHEKPQQKVKDMTVLVKYGQRLIENVQEALKEISKLNLNVSLIIT
ncbi:uncharacterized protein LOC128551324 [Mercenaria mercenaria]|uniref:uncharacterized protein LOC128551324 n=1 Tax=Mercenaria mercenaria TaxID=6596 RepID=UPI00234E379A|nr:uncharacterized protein LOC128551324 [Mercenaria mercenaria]